MKLLENFIDEEITMSHSLLENIKLLLIDIDGVVIKGSSPIEGAAEGIRKLRENGARTMIITNNSTRSRETLVQWLRRTGIEVGIEDILATAYCAAQYVLKLGLEKVYIIGESGLIDEFKHANLKIINDDTEDCDAVVVGLDRNYNYDKLTTAFKLIRKGAKFIATNKDASLPQEKDEIPGAAAMVSSLEGCTFKRPIVLGKPNTYLMRLALKMTGYNVRECGIVGDRPETDMAMAKRGGCLGILVLTGIATSRRLDDYLIHQRPDMIYSSLLELAEEYETAKRR